MNTAAALRLVAVTAAERPRFEAMFQYYLYDMAEFTGARLSSSGQYKYPFSTLDVYWQNPQFQPYFAFSGNELVGFALVRPCPEDPQRFDMEQFFILRHLRRQGLGQSLLQGCVERHPGRWRIRVMTGNERAWQFWTAAIASLNPCGYEEGHCEEDGLEMRTIAFSTRMGAATS